MTSLRKVLLRLYLPFGIVLLVTAVYHLLNDYEYSQAKENIVKLQVSRHRRENPTGIHYCKFNQYYDQEEGRCLGVPGGGKVLHVENERSCGINILKPHCSSPRYYHICKRDKSILAQCANRQIFDSRLQRCAYYDSSKLTPSIISPDDHGYYEHVSIPKCTKLGQFPVPDHCFMFYTCDTNGHRLHQSVFKCPRNTGYQADRRVCAVTSDCENDDSVDSAFCVPDAPGENVESLNSKETAEENTGETTEETMSINDSSKKEESNFRTYDIISTTSESITGNSLSVDNYGDKGSNLYKASLSPTQPTQDISISDTDETSMLKQTLNPIESAQEIQNEKDDSVSPLDVQITPSPTVELGDNVSHSMMTLTPVYNTDTSSNVDKESETVDTIPFSTVSYTSTKLDKRTYYVTTEQYNDDGTVTLPNSNMETLDSPSTISNIPGLSSVNEESLKKEETRDVTEEVDLYRTSTMSNIPESSPIDMSSKLDEGTQNTFTEEYRNNDDGTTILPNSNTETLDPLSIVRNTSEFSSINDKALKADEEMRDVTEAVDSYQTSTISNIPESSPIIDTPSKLDEGTQDTFTEEHRNNDDGTTTLPNINTETLDSSSTIRNTSDFPSINDKSLKANEETRDVTEAVDSYQTSTISNIPESSPIIDTPFKLDEGTQDTFTEEHRNNDDGTTTLPNINTETLDSSSTIRNTSDFPSINDKSLKANEETRDVTEAVDSYQTSTISNIPESSPIIDTPFKLDEGTQDTFTEEHRNNDDGTTALPNINTETLDSSSTIRNTSDFPSINDKSLKANEETRDVTEAVDSYQTSTISNIPESSPIIDTPFKLDEGTQDTFTEEHRNNDDGTTTLPNLNTETLDSSSTIRNTSDFPSINDKSLKADEETRDVTEAVDSYQTSTISNIPESSPIIDSPFKLDEGTQNAFTEEHRNNDDGTAILPNSNTEAIDSTSTISNIPEFPPISKTTSKLYEETQSATTEQYENDRIMTPPNSNTEIVDQNPTPILGDISATNSPSDNLDTSTLASVISPQADINDNQYAKELFTTSPSIDSKLTDLDLNAPKDIENVSTKHSSKHTDTLDLASTSSALEHITASMDITTTASIIQDLPAFPDTDLITQNSKDNTDTMPVIEQDAPITNN